MRSKAIGPARRLALLLVALSLSLVALAFRSELQTWAFGVGRGVLANRGKPAPEIPTSARTLAGAPLRLSDLRGRVVLLHFFTFD
jgi:hypothetical protein